MKILSDAESTGIKILVTILVAALIACAFWKFNNNNNYTRSANGAESAFDGRCSGCGEPVPVIHDTVTLHDTVVDIHAVTKTVHDTVYIGGSTTDASLNI